jgi:hypothetical protein
MGLGHSALGLFFPIAPLRCWDCGADRTYVRPTKKIAEKKIGVLADGRGACQVSVLDDGGGKRLEI